MKRKHRLSYFGFLIFVFLFAGCEGADLNAGRIVEQIEGYEKITIDQVRQIASGDIPYILLDVRSQSEHDARHLPKSLLIPSNQLKERAESELLEKDSLILVYCAAGGRSKTASEILIEAGYTYVKDIGGIDSWSDKDIEAMHIK